jgi:chromosome segregation ATPase
MYHWLQQLTHQGQQKDEAMRNMEATIEAQGQQLEQYEESLRSVRAAMEKFGLRSFNAEELARGAHAHLANLQNEIVVLQTAPEGFLQQKAQLEAEVGEIKTAMAQISPEITGDLTHRVQEMENTVQRLAVSSGQNLQALHQEFERTLEGATVQIQMHTEHALGEFRKKLAEAGRRAAHQASEAFSRASEEVGQHFVAQAKIVAEGALEQFEGKIQGLKGSIPRDPPLPLSSHQFQGHKPSNKRFATWREGDPQCGTPPLPLSLPTQGLRRPESFRGHHSSEPVDHRIHPTSQPHLRSCAPHHCA